MKRTTHTSELSGTYLYTVTALSELLTNWRTALVMTGMMVLIGLTSLITGTWQAGLVVALLAALLLRGDGFVPLMIFIAAILPLRPATITFIYGGTALGFYIAGCLVRAFNISRALRSDKPTSYELVGGTVLTNSNDSDEGIG